MTGSLEVYGRWLVRAVLLGLLVVAIFGPITNMLIWTVTEKWYFPHKLPLEYGFTYWQRVFAPRGGAIESLTNSIVIACGTVILSLAMAVPARSIWATSQPP